MQRVNADYADRVGGMLDDAVKSLRAVSDDGAEVASGLEALRIEATDTLGLTLNEAESLRSDICRFGVEQSTKRGDLTRLEAKLEGMRQERQERRDELESERDELKRAFEEKSKGLGEKQASKEQSELGFLKSMRSAFEEERAVLEARVADLSKQYDEQRRYYDDKESSLQAKIASLKADTEKLSTEHGLAMAAKQAEIESVRARLETEKARRAELEDHFARVDRDNAAKAEEEEKLQLVHELEEKANRLLDDGAIALQKLWRGVKDRAVVAKLKNKKKKGKGKGGKKKKK